MIFRLLIGIGLAVLLAGCGPTSDPAGPPSAPPEGAEPAAAARVTFTDVTARSGVTFTHNTGAFGEKWLPEAMGSGVVIFDANGDQRLDLLFLNGTRFEGHAYRSWVLFPTPNAITLSASSLSVTASVL